MHFRIAATLSVVTLVLSGLTACSTPSDATAKAPAGPADAASPATALPSEHLKERLLTAADLAPGTTVRSGAVSKHSDVSVLGCEPLERLAEGTGDPYASFPARAKTVIVGPGGRRATQELYSAPPADLTEGTHRIMAAMAACPSYQLATATAVAQIDTRTVPAPTLGQEQWAQVVTARAGDRSTVTEQVIVLDDVLLLVVSGPPSHARQLAEKAWAKAHSY